MSTDARVVSCKGQRRRAAAIATPFPLGLCQALEKLVGGRSGPLCFSIKGKTSWDPFITSAVQDKHEQTGGGGQRSGNGNNCHGNRSRRGRSGAEGGTDRRRSENQRAGDSGANYGSESVASRHHGRRAVSCSLVFTRPPVCSTSHTGTPSAGSWRCGGWHRREPE